MSVELEQIVGEALERPPAERKAFLAQACTGDARLQREAESLLKAFDQAGEFLSDPTGPAGVAGGDLRVEATGTRIGPYKLLERIGEGGFGAVYLAEQNEPVQRRVALKVIKAGMDTRQVIARFEAERQALALMDHPNIARVLDAGTTDLQSPLGSGRPYFVMELVKGVPITQFCDEERLTLRERLSLFIDACHAVQHAHQKGVIHRDLKPSNVLVSRYDDTPVVKIIDFGIAKATAGTGPLTEKTLFTELRQMIGTPAYMSPEQAGLSDLDIDTRSDIYSLGVLLYELLAGTTPFDAQRLRSADFDELRRIIREEEPPRPSTRVSALRTEPRRPRSGSSPAEDSDERGLAHAPGSDSSTAAAIAAARHKDPRSLVRSLSGEPDWIVMKCLEKDRARRYETANDVAADVQRYLQHEPVLAGPPSRLYRFQKFARRNRATVTAATLVAAALLAGMAGTTLGLLKAEERRIEAEEAQGLAEQRAKQTQQVADFQAAMLRGIDVEAMGRGIQEGFREQVRAALERQYVGAFPDSRKRTDEEIEAELAAFDERASAAQAADVARSALDEFVLARAAGALEEQFAGQPLVQAQLHDAIGRTYLGLALHDAAELHLRKALEIRRRELSGDHPDTLNSNHMMGLLAAEQGRLAEAEQYYHEALEGRRRVLGAAHPDTLKTIGNVGVLFKERGNLAMAEKYCREALEGYRRVQGTEHPDTLRSLSNVGSVLQAQDRVAEAEPYLREALAGQRRVLGNDHRGTLFSISNMGALLFEQGKLSEAEQYHREALEGRRRVLGNDHPDTLWSIENMGALLVAQGKPAEAEQYYREALEGRRRVLGNEHWGTLASISHMGALLRAQGKLAEAEKYCREALAGRRRMLGSDHPDTLTSICDMGALLVAQGKPAEAEQYFREALEGWREDDAHPSVALSLSQLANVLDQNGDAAGAEAALAELLVLLERLDDVDDPRVAAALDNTANFYRSQHRPAEALPVYEAALAMRQRVYPGDHPDIARTLSDLGYVLMRDRPAEALPRYEAALEMRQRLYPGDHWDVAWTLNELAYCLYLLDRPAEALPKQEAAQAIWKRLVPDGDANIANSLSKLSSLLVEKGKCAEAETLLRDVLAIAAKGPTDSSPAARAAQTEAVAVLAQALLAAAKPEEAREVWREYVEDLRRRAPTDPETAAALRLLAEKLRAAGQLDDAEALARQAVEIHGANPAPEARKEYGRALVVLSDTLVDLAKLDEATLIGRECAENLRRLVPADDLSLAGPLGSLAYLLLQQRQFAEAEPLLREALAIRENAGSQNHPEYANDLIRLGESLVAQGGYAEGEQVARQAADLYRANPGWWSARSWQRLAADVLAQALVQQEKYAEAEPVLRELLASGEDDLAVDSPSYWRLANARSLLGSVLARHGVALTEADASAAIARFSEAEPLLVEAATWLMQHADRIAPQYRAERPRQAAERIVELYKSWDTVAPGSGKAEQAARWQTELDKLLRP